MHKRIALAGCCLIFALLQHVHVLWGAAATGAESRVTPIVTAVQRVRSATVNIHSEKRAKPTDALFSVSKERKINGMGTGIVVDERGYIVTNYHVVEGVDSLRVTMFEGGSYTADVRSYDRARDLAIIKIDPVKPLDVMPLGTSSDLMLGEDVLAIGNAFGYEHTVTRGIISALSRDVEVNEEQSYKNLIQIDAAINPGNSGGPLLNREGEVIGINVAIRAGAERIAFAIPIDDAREVIAKLLNVERLDNSFHGLRARDYKHGADRKLIVEGVVPESPASSAGLQPGDIVVKAGSVEVIDAADFERAVLGHSAGERLDVVIKRGESTQTLSLQVASRSPQQTIATHKIVSQTQVTPPVVRGQDADLAWSVLGMKLMPLAGSEKGIVAPRYNGGMKVIEVRAESPSQRNGIRSGDILVGLHVWETITHDNVEYVVTHQNLTAFNPLKFYVLRGTETLYGYLQLSP